MPVAPVTLPNLRITDNALNVAFEMDINDNLQLSGTFMAPTTGWLAIGLNSISSLNGTRFLMAARDETQSVRAEEHIAQPPEHQPITHFKASPMFTLQKLEQADGNTSIQFTANRSVPAPHPCNFAPGSEAELMLAWSQQPDFDHHSAWRRHFPVKV